MKDQRQNSYANPYDNLEKQITEYKSTLHFDSRWPMDIQHLVTYIHAHLFDEGLTVTEIKRQCRVHDNNISGRFAYYVGRSIKSYINSHRIRIAKNLLAHKGLKVVQIALVVGYASHGAFTRAFRSHVGCTPSEFQEQIQERSKEKKKERMLSDE